MGITRVPPKLGPLVTKGVSERCKQSLPTWFTMSNFIAVDKTAKGESMIFHWRRPKAETGVGFLVRGSNPFPTS